MMERLREAAATRPSLLVSGSRQVGKTSLLRQVFPDATYVTFDNLLNVASAQEAPQAFLDRFAGPVILDEVQYVPALFPALKERIDSQRDTMGRWLLTGSQRFELMTNVTESLAGRIALFHLEPLSAAELRTEASIPREALRDLHMLGGYPELWKSPAIDRSAWYEDYIRTYIERDLAALVQVRNLVEFRRFLGLLAARAGQLLNHTDLGRACGVTNNTTKTWLSALETTGLAYTLQPYFSNIEKRLIKSPKVYFADTGLLSALLGIETADQLQASSLAGQIWENFTFTELVKNGQGTPGKNLFFYRDHAGTEVDFVIQKAQGLELVEAKYSERIRSERLSFTKVASALPVPVVQTRVAAPTGQAMPLPMDGYVVYDPRYSE